MTLRILTLIFNLLIIIGAGHGIGPLALLEFLSVRELLTRDFQFNISGRYDERLLTVGLISLLGQCVLIFAFFVTEKIKTSLTIAGCAILLIATYLLTQDAWDLSIDIISLVTALPFIGTAVTLLIKEISRSN